jgi:hypothetical protein
MTPPATDPFAFIRGSFESCSYRKLNDHRCHHRHQRPGGLLSGIAAPSLCPSDSDNPLCAPLQPASASRLSFVLWLLVLAAVITGSLLSGAVAARIPLAAGRSAILITHRLTTAMRADVIHVMSGGKVVESGAHEELLSRGGLYAQSWLAQTATPAAVP